MKPCKTCGVVKPAKEFYKMPRMADGRLNECKPCFCLRVRTNYYAKHKEKCLYERQRAKRPDRRAKALEYQRERRAREPMKNIARSRLTYAVRSGNIIKPTTCPHCGSTDRIQAHHHDYSKPLDVAWACFKCHREIYHKQICSD